MVLGDVEETVTTREIDEETYEEIVKVFYLEEGRSNSFTSRNQREMLKCYLLEEIALF
jgi:hypothetical protein